MASFKEQLSACMQDDPPPCAAACPFGLDVRAFAAHLKRGAFGPAYRMYRDATAFPGIVSRLCPHPCEAGCVFAEKGGAIALSALERAAVAHAPNPKPNRYNLPKKTQRVAIVGAGPCGLACALRLASKKYAVTVYERAARFGGSLRGALPDEAIDAEIEMQFMHEAVDFRFETEVRDLSELDADAVFLATGRGGEAFGMALSGTGECASGREGVFLGGGLVGKEPMAAIADGLTASRAIERFLKTGGRNEPFRDHSTRFHPDPALIPYAPPVQAADALYTQEEAAAEAQRCHECRCDACVTYCDLMRSHHKYPKRIEEEVTTTIEPVSLSRKARLATRLIAACDQCGLCKAVCPAGIDVGAFLRESQQKMQELGAMPWAFHEFYLRDMAFMNGEASLLLSPSGSKTPRYLFFPGCRLSGSAPELTEKAFDALRGVEPDSAILLSCCGASASWAGKAALHEAALAHLREAWRSLGEPTLVFACMSCRREFERYLPEMASTSLYEVLDAGLETVPAAGMGMTVSVFDPCSSRDYPETQRAVRSLAEKAGFSLRPLPMEGKYARCCGWGGHVALSNPGYASDVTASRAQESDAPYLAYCANCRDVFARAEKPAAHILEALLAAPAWDRAAPTADESRENRRALKRRLQERFAPEEVTAVEEPKIQLSISRELLEKMDRDHLLREDAEAAVLHCEESGRFLVDAERCSRAGHTRVGNTTVWVEYRPAAEGFELLGAYAHRMRIVEGDGNG